MRLREHTGHLPRRLALEPLGANLGNIRATRSREPDRALHWDNLGVCLLVGWLVCLSEKKLSYFLLATTERLKDTNNRNLHLCNTYLYR